MSISDNNFSAPPAEVSVSLRLRALPTCLFYGQLKDPPRPLLAATHFRGQSWLLLRTASALTDTYKSPIYADGASSPSGGRPGRVGVHGGESGVGEFLLLSRSSCYAPPP